MSTIWDLVGLEEVEISNDRIISLKGRCRASDFKKSIVEVDDYGLEKKYWQLLTV